MRFGVFFMRSGVFLCGLVSLSNSLMSFNEVCCLLMCFSVFLFGVYVCLVIVSCQDINLCFLLVFKFIAIAHLFTC